jgi:hypothetical protein
MEAVARCRCKVSCPAVIQSVGASEFPHEPTDPSRPATAIGEMQRERERERERASEGASDNNRHGQRSQETPWARAAETS